MQGASAVGRGCMTTEVMQGASAVGTGGMTTEIMQGASAAWMVWERYSVCCATGGFQ